MCAEADTVPVIECQNEWGERWAILDGKGWQCATLCWQHQNTQLVMSTRTPQNSKQRHGYSNFALKTAQTNCCSST